MKWDTLCKRTNDPKLSFIEHALDLRGIPHRRDGESWHAPILQVPEENLDAAGGMLSESARQSHDLPVRFGVCLDDVPDDHECFREYMPC